MSPEEKRLILLNQARISANKDDKSKKKDMSLDFAGLIFIGVLILIPLMIWIAQL